MTYINSIHDIMLSYLEFDFTQIITNAIAVDCANFLVSKDIDNDLIRKNFIIEFKIANDQSSVEVKGGNLLSALWIIGIYPDEPQKYINYNMYSFQGKKYIYEPRNKSLKITNYGENSRNR